MLVNCRSNQEQVERRTAERDDVYWSVAAGGSAAADSVSGALAEIREEEEKAAQAEAAARGGSPGTPKPKPKLARLCT